MKEFSPNTRQMNLQKLQSEEFDLIVIGGGINGAGVARDAASRGMKVALIEARDFASGTSSKSSKLIHGGIRYLENKEFRLVFEALSERTKLFEIAPHLVHPLRFMIPIYKNSRVGMGLMGLGMWLYDILAMFQSPEMHERLNGRETLEAMPALNPHEVVGSYIYSDAYMDDDRLVHETMRSANDYGAVCVNYVKAVGLKTTGEKNYITGIQVEDVLTKKNFIIEGRHVVSTVGPWTDELGEMIFDSWKKILRPTKGVHITLPRGRLPLQSAVVMGAEKSDRIVFGIPRHEMIIVGTTDTDFKGNLNDVEATPEDIRYLLNVAHQYFPGAELKADDIIASYAGVRPLVKDDSTTEGKTSREHTILNDDRGITFLAGGKYTTYRLMCQQTVEKVLKRFPIEDRVRFNNSLSEKPLNPNASVDALHQARLQVEILAQEFGRDLENVRLLVERHGLEAAAIMRKYPKSYTYWQLEAAHAIDSTMCMSLVDFYARRVPLFLAHTDHGVSLLPEVGAVFKEKLQWSDEVLAMQSNLLLEYMAHEIEWKKSLS